MKLMGLLIIVAGFVGMLEAVDLRVAGYKHWGTLLLMASATAVVGGAWLFERKPGQAEKPGLRYRGRR